MTLTILAPTSQKQIEVTWIEAHTTQGNYVILPGHAPLTVQLQPHMPLTIGLHNATETIAIAQGILHVDRHKATVIIDE